MNTAYGFPSISGIFRLYMPPTNIVNELLLSGKNKNQKKNIYVLKGFQPS